MDSNLRKISPSPCSSEPCSLTDFDYAELREDKGSSYTKAKKPRRLSWCTIGIIVAVLIVCAVIITVAVILTQATATKESFTSSELTTTSVSLDKTSVSATTLTSPALVLTTRASLPDQTTTPASDGSIRLVYGNTFYEGRIELFYNGEWGTICNDFADQKVAAVACRQLGYTGGVLLHQTQVPDGTGPIWLDHVQCIGNESSLLNCTYRLPIGTHGCTHIEDFGIRCSVDWCASSPCLTNQNCTSMGDTYVCSCFSNNTSSSCELGVTDPCNKYETLNDTWRNPLTSGIKNPRCDISLKQGWYRFMLDTFSADMLTIVPPFDSCGTSGQIWWDGPIASRYGQVTQGTGCIAHLDSCDVTYSVNDILMKHCGTYKVYFLKPALECYTAYCMAVEPCISGLCLNGGTCNIVDSYYSECDCSVVGFSGYRCETDACYRYTTLNETWRVASVSGENDNYHDDINDIENGWYRFILNGNSANMLTSPPPSKSCGTREPIWWKGPIAINYGQITIGTGCSVFDERTCDSFRSSSNITMKNCGTYNVYYLKRPVLADSAYCMG